jgi:hypothetical protein
MSSEKIYAEIIAGKRWRPSRNADEGIVGNGKHGFDTSPGENQEFLLYELSAKYFPREAAF